MSTGKHVRTAAESFDAIAADPASLRSFLACIGSSDAPSRVRAAQLSDDHARVLDVGCGPAVMFETLQDRRTPVAAPLSYVGVDPVDGFLALAQARVPAAIDVTGSATADVDSLAEIRSPHALVLDDPAAYLNRCRPRSFDAVLMRHVVEHVPDPLPLLRAAARAARRLVVVVVSQETRSAGIPRSLLTDTHLGALRWSHWRPDLLATMARDEPSWSLHAHEQGPPLVVREELFAWVRA